MDTDNVTLQCVIAFAFAFVFVFVFEIIFEILCMRLTGGEQ